MFDFGSFAEQRATHTGRTNAYDNALFRAFKRLLDISVSIMLLPMLLVFSTLLLVLNPIFNRGPVFFVQQRMGKNCRAFSAIKFRSMYCRTQVMRGANDPLEVDQIPAIGHILRQTRIDEIPQILNVLRGDMSLIGPRPDCYDHAVYFLQTVPGYRERHAVLPGISGYAQTEIGYVQGVDETCEKVAADLYYISHRNIGFEARIFWRTLVTVIRRNGQ